MSSAPAAARHLVRALFTLALLGVIAALGQIPFGEPSSGAELRLALRTVQGKVRVCRQRSPEELEALPRHMRTATVCDDVAPGYDLRVRIDGRTLLEQTVSPGGLRGDRPLIVDRRLSVPPGAATVEVGFVPSARTGLTAEQLAQLPRYELVETVDFRPGRITLVLIDGVRDELTLYAGD